MSMSRGRDTNYARSRTVSQRPACGPLHLFENYAIVTFTRKKNMCSGRLSHCHARDRWHAGNSLRVWVRVRVCASLPVPFPGLCLFLALGWLLVRGLARSVRIARLE